MYQKYRRKAHPSPGARLRPEGFSATHPSMECTRCGACCVAPDIAALDKPLGLRCPHLTDTLLCRVYEARPDICRSYQADEVCERISADSLEERVAKYLALFELGDEAARVKAAGCTSLRAFRDATKTVMRA